MWLCGIKPYHDFSYSHTFKLYFFYLEIVFCISWIIAALLFYKRDIVSKILEGAKQKFPRIFSKLPAVQTVDRSPSRLTDWLWDFIAFLFWGGCTSAVLAWIDVAGRGSVNHLENGAGRVALLSFGIFLAAVAHICGELAFIGITSRRIGSEDDREWLARSSGYVLMACVLWTALSCISLYVPVIGLELMESAQGSTTASASHGTPSDEDKLFFLMHALLFASLIFGAASAMLGRSSKTGALEFDIDTPLRKIAVYSSAIGFLASILSALSILLVYVTFNVITMNEGRLFQFSGPGRMYLDFLFSGDAANINKLLTTFAILVIFIFTFGRLINVNRFSLHAMYRNRLVRTFLGASNSAEDRNLFTWFDNNDNLKMCDLQQISAGDWHPYLVVNATLNEVATSNLAWQERKAQSFVFTPYHCGADAIRSKALQPSQRPTFKTEGAYRSSRQYGGGEKSPITLGTAMAISGAALSPNMGYHSSPLVTLIMTLFNVRLGWWLGNPNDNKTFKKEGPDSATGPLIAELFGWTRNDTGFIHLSDGGHFENLGLYEMVRRRCHFIIVSDAGADPLCEFEDLANATRKIYIDFGIPIIFEDLSAIRLRSNSAEKDSGPIYVMGTIDYRSVDGSDAKNGKIIYIKPSVHWNEPSDVVGYALAHLDFPHEGTANQWFTESQFESYRSLGSHMMKSVIALRCGAETDIYRLF